MNILITGATGFIGRPLATKLAAEGCAVRAAVWRKDSSQELPKGIQKAIVDAIGTGE